MESALYPIDARVVDVSEIEGVIWKRPFHEVFYITLLAYQYLFVILSSVMPLYPQPCLGLRCCGCCMWSESLRLHTTLSFTGGPMFTDTHLLSIAHLWWHGVYTPIVRFKNTTTNQIVSSSYVDPREVGDSAYERGGDARGIFWIKTLKGDRSGLGPSFFLPLKETMLKHRQYIVFACNPKRDLHG